jgi:hypothetical protein
MKTLATTATYATAIMLAIVIVTASHCVYIQYREKMVEPV